MAAERRGGMTGNAAMEKIYVKNMVCDRCVMVVRDIVGRVVGGDALVGLGEVTLGAPLPDATRAGLDRELRAVGFEIIDDRRKVLVERIKGCVRGLVRADDSRPGQNLSDYVASSLGRDYSSLSTLFSESEGRTLEQYYILQKVERVKELIAYGDKTLSEIAYALNYSSAAHMSNQFKKATGMTPSQFKGLSDKRRKAIDKV